MDLSQYSTAELEAMARQKTPVAEALQFSGTTGRSATNNNPLNLEYRPGSYQDKHGAVLEPPRPSGSPRRFAAFPNMEAGYQAGLDQIRLDQGRGHTLASFVEKFAPRHENPTDELIAQYAKATGAAADTPLSHIPAEKLIVPMLQRESSTKITKGGQPEVDLSKYSDAELQDMLRRSAYGLGPQPPAVKPVGVASRIAGNLNVGTSEAVGRSIGLAQTLVGPETAAAFSSVEPADATGLLAARRKAEQDLLSASGKAVLEQPATSIPGQLAEGLVRTIPELPLFYGMGEGVNLALRGGALLPRVGSAIAKVADYLAPEVIAGASTLGALPRIAAHGALTGAALGATTAPEGERLTQSGEEALGFAVAAPAFHLAGKAIVGLGKAAIRTTGKIPANFRTEAEATAKYDLSEPMPSYKAAKEAQGDGSVVRVAGEWRVAMPKGGAEPAKADLDAAELPGRTFSTMDDVLTAKATNEPPSGAPSTVVETKDGKFVKVPDYSVPSEIEQKVGITPEVKEISARLTQIDKELLEPGADTAMLSAERTELVRKGREILEPSKPTFVEEIKAVKGVEEAEPLRLNLNEAEPEAAAKPLPTTPEEVQAVVAPVTGEVKAKVVRRSIAPERDRVQAELDAAHPQVEEGAGAKALLEARAKQFEREGQGSTEDFYRGITIRGTEGPLDAQGSVTFDGGKQVLSLFKTANFSTVVHESWHIFQNTLPPSLVNDLGKWRGKVLGEWKTEDYEHVAKAFERFFAEGRVEPKEWKEIGITAKVAKIFAQFKQWLLDIYTSIKGSDIDVELNHELENVFRKSLGLKEVEALSGSIEAKPAATPLRPMTEEAYEERLIQLQSERASLAQIVGPEAKETLAKDAEIAELVARHDDIVTDIEPAPSTYQQLMARYDAEMDKLEHLSGDAYTAQLENLKAARLALEAYETDNPKVLYQLGPKGEEGIKDYDKKGQTEEYLRDVKTLSGWQQEQKAINVADARASADAKHAGQVSSGLMKRILSAQMKLKGVDEAVATPFMAEVQRAWSSTSYMKEITRAWSHGPEAVTLAINRNDLVKLGNELGMKKQITEAITQKREMEVMRSIFDRVYNLVDVAREPDIEGATKQQLIEFTDLMRTANDAITTWWQRITESYNYLLKETPYESSLKQVGAWLEDRLGYSPKALDRYTQAAYKMTVNMQHAARRWAVLQPIFRLGQEKQSVTTELRKGLLFGDLDAKVTGWTFDEAGKKVKREFALPGIKTSYYDLVGDRPDLAKVVDRILLDYDKLPEAPPLTAETALKLKRLKALSQVDKQLVAKAVGDVRETLDYTYFKLRNDFESSLDPHLSQEVRDKSMKAWDKEHNYHPNYFPHIREGSIVVQVLDSEGNTIYSARTDSGFEANKLKAELQAQYPKLRVGDFSTRQAPFTGISGAALRQFVSNIEKRAAEAGEEVGRFSAIAERMLKEYGLKGHYIARETPEGVPGFEENVGKALISYSNLFATHLGKMDFLRKAFEEIGNLKGYGRIQDYAREWVDLTLRPSNRLDDAIITMKNLAFMKYIGGVLKTAVVTTFDKITNAYPMMGMYVKNPGALMAGGYKDGTKFMLWERSVSSKLVAERLAAREAGRPFNDLEALRRIRSEEPLPKGIEQWEADGLLRLRKTGRLDSVWTQLLLEQHKNEFDRLSPSAETIHGTAEGLLRRGWDKSLEWSGKLVGTAEGYGRLTTALSAMRMFKQLGYSEADAVAAGGRFMIDAHGYYGKMNLPLWMMKDVGKLARLPFTFRVFEHHYTELVGSMLFGQQGAAGRQAALKSLGLLAGLGGMMSLPFLTSASKVFRAATGTDPEQYVRKQLSSIDNSQTLADMFSYGMPASVAGIGMPAISLRSSTEVGKIRPEELIFGAPGGLVRDVAKASTSAMGGDWNGFFDSMLPSVLKNPKKAYERYYYGAIGPSGKKLTEGPLGEQIKYGPGEALGQVFGFTPAKIEKYYQQAEVAEADKAYWAEKRKAIYTRLQRAFNTGDEAGINKAFEAINSYNERALNTGPDVVLITPSVVKQSLKDRVEKKKMLQAERLGLR